MVRSTVLRRWQADVLGALDALDGVEPALLIIDDRDVPSRAPLERIRRLGSSQHMLWDLYNNGWVGRRAASLRPVDRTDAWAGLPRIQVTVEQRGFSEYFPDDVIEQIRSYDLDFILRFAFGIIRGPILETARHGVWSFHHGDEMQYRGSPPAFWEVVRREPVTGTILQRLTDRLDGGVVLDKGWFNTAQHSYVRNTDTVHLGASGFPARVAARLLRDGELRDLRASSSTAPIYKRPTNTETAVFLLSQVWRAATRQARALTEADHWRIGISHSPIGLSTSSGISTDLRWLPLDEPGVAYAADPFVVPDADPATVLYERFDSNRRIGEIWQAHVDGGEDPRPAGIPVTAHASYPFCFRHDGRTLCVPQVAADGVPMFELDGDEWKHVADLLPGERVLDPTILEHERNWWLFGTKPGDRSLDQLHLWHAESPLGPWTPHRLNPVKTDVRSARPAGTPFRSGGNLYRPAQDCAQGYGRGVALCRIERLDRQEFNEVVERVLEPAIDWGSAVGMHTISGAGELTVIDTRRRIFDRHESAAELRARLRRIMRRGRSSSASGELPGSDRMRVLAIINALGEGGTERSLAELVEPLRERGIDVSIAILRSRGAEGVENWLREQGVDIHMLPPGRRAYPAFRSLVRTLRPDVIHSMLFEANMVARLSTIGLGVPVLTSLVNTSYAPERLATVSTSPWKVRTVQAVDAVTGWLFVDHFHVVSEAVKVDAVRRLRVRPAKITVAQRGRKDPLAELKGDERMRIRSEFDIAENDLVVVNVGRHEHQKDQVTLVASMAPILHERDDIWLWIVGRDGNASADLRRAIADHKVEDRVLLTGHRSDVPAVLAAADVFAMTSRYEGLPGAMIEAIAMGLPVVGSDIAPIREVVDARCALLAPAADAVSFSRCTRQLLDDAVARSELGSNGRRRYEDSFSMGRSADNFARALSAALGSKQASDDHQNTVGT